MTARERPAGRGQPVEPEQLLAEAGWLRGLARRLAGDPELALELEQDTWRAALAHPPQAGPGLRAWLGTVAANLLRRRRRDELARRWHEAAAAGPEARPEDATLERLELQARIVAALRSLPEPYRTAVALRHLDGLAYGEVARRTHVDEAAARQRVSRGLKQLRARLDRAYGGRAAWGVAAFALGRDLPLPASATTVAAAGGAGAAALLGGIGMSAGIKVAAAVGAGLLVAGGWWWAERDRGGGASPERAAAAPAAGEPALADARSPAALDDLGGGGEGRGALAEAPPPAAAPTPAAADERIAGVVLDARGAPVAGAAVELLRCAGRDYGTLDLEFGAVEELVERARTGADGRFALPADPLRRYALRASAAGLAPAERSPAFAGDEVELRVRPAASISGLVLRPDDLPAIGAEVVLRPSSRGAGFARRRALTDSGGGYRFDGVEAGEYLLSVTSSEGATPERCGVAVEPGDAQRVDLHLLRGIELRGRVTDAATGAPIAGAEVCESWIFAKSVRTDADGAFVYPDYPHEGYQEITVRARGYGRRCVDVLGPFESVPAKSFLEVELQPAATVSGRVVDADGRPLASVYVACAASVFTDDGQQTDWRSARTDEAGRYRIDDVRTDVTHALFLQRDGLGTAVYEIGVPRPEHEVPDLVLRPGSPVSGRVVDPSGAGVPGAEVALQGCNPDRSSRFGQPAESCLDSYVAERETRTDAQGRFAFTDVCDGEYAVVARLAGTRGGERRALEVDGAPLDVGALELAAGLSIGGRVVGPEGEGASGVYVNAWREDGRAGEGASVLTGTDGGFELAGLEPGDYRLQFVPYESHEGRFFAGALRGAVPAGTAGLLVQLADAADLRGRVLDSAGAPVAGVSVEMRVPNEPGAWEQTNVEGRFVFHPPRGARVELCARPQKAHPDLSLPFQYDPDPAREARLAGVDAEGGEVLLVLPDAR